MNDLFEAGVQNPNLAIIYEANSKNKVAVKTPNGLSERVSIDNIVMQGEFMAPLECSVSLGRSVKLRKNISTITKT